jgi:FSR family fosmidomycin resistance protein-like MFS transporter
VQRVDHARYTLLIFVLPTLLASAIEAPLTLLSDRVPRKFVLAAGLAALAIALALSALTSQAWLLSLGLSAAGAASGIACACAQAELVGAAPERAARAMSRWMAFASLGDVLSPIVVGAMLASGASYRAALGVVAGAVACQALLVLRSGSNVRAVEPRACETEVRMPLTAAAVLARQPQLWLCLLAAAFCSLLDEVVVALAALRLHVNLGWSSSFATWATIGFPVGGVIGAITAERLLARHSPRSVLIASATACLVALVLFLASRSPVTVLPALVLLGACAAPHYPIVKAAAYDLAPGKPGLVNALAQLFSVLEVGMPWLLGLIATRYGLAAAIAALAAQPLLLLALALRSR